MKWMSFVTFGRQRVYEKLHPAGRLPESGLRLELSGLTSSEENTSGLGSPNGEIPKSVMQSSCCTVCVEQEHVVIRCSSASLVHAGAAEIGSYWPASKKRSAGPIFVKEIRVTEHAFLV